MVPSVDFTTPPQLLLRLLFIHYCSSLRLWLALLRWWAHLLVFINSHNEHRSIGLIIIEDRKQILVNGSLLKSKVDILIL